jgi:hypothetical protein
MRGKHVKSASSLQNHAQQSNEHASSVVEKRTKTYKNVQSLKSNVPGMRDGDRDNIAIAGLNALSRFSVGGIAQCANELALPPAADERPAHRVPPSRDLLLDSSYATFLT